MNAIRPSCDYCQKVLPDSGSINAEADVLIPGRAELEPLKVRVDVVVPHHKIVCWECREKAILLGIQALRKLKPVGAV